MKFSDVISRNLEALSFAESVCDEIKKQVMPVLQQRGIKVFAYFRFFNNGRYLSVCNRMDWLKFCVENVHSNEGTSLGESLNSLNPTHNSHCFLWPTVKKDYLMSALHEHNIFNGLSVFQYHEDYVDLCGSAAENKDTQLKYEYIEKLDFYTNFSNFFVKKYNNLLIEGMNSLAVYRDFVQKIKPLQYNQSHIQDVLKKTRPKSRPIITTSGEKFLRIAQLEILGHLSMGRTAKEIANEMGGNADTIEKNIARLKKSLNCNNKSDLIAVFNNSLNHWL